MTNFTPCDTEDNVRQIRERAEASVNGWAMTVILLCDEVDRLRRIVKGMPDASLEPVDNDRIMAAMAHQFDLWRLLAVLHRFANDDTGRLDTRAIARRVLKAYQFALDVTEEGDGCKRAEITAVSPQAFWDVQTGETWPPGTPAPGGEDDV